MRMRRSTAAAALLLFLTMTGPAWCTVLVDFRVTLAPGTDAGAVAERLRSLSLANCKFAQREVWHFTQILVRMECTTGKDANTALVQDVSAIAGVKEIAVFGISGQ
jgi:hypothetical protein